MPYRKLSSCVEWALMVALVLGAGAMARAQQAAQQEGGRVVQIGRAEANESAPAVPPPQNPAGGALNRSGGLAIEQPSISKYWIGLRAGAIGDDDPLRAHVDLPDDVGLLVVEIVPDGPAAKAGLKKYDILLRANDAGLHQMTELIELVSTEGEKKSQIAVDILRHGDRETVFITPEERPASAQQPLAGGGEMGMPGDLLGQWQGRGPLFQFRNLGPGVIIGGQGLANIPNGVAVSIQKEAGKPTRITVKRGDETWEVVGDDAESLKKLPEDLRPFVEQMLQGEMPLGGGMRMPNLEMPNLERWNRPGVDDEQLRQRLDQMERQMNELLERLGKGEQAEAPPQAEEEQAK